ncbi:MAG: hypothetical protein QOJ64_2138 [Acidobacteriota bacterium]|jgi:hypothetical protein|nr:hypothetical protein [Acidobacteriota bacterium]
MNTSETLDSKGTLPHGRRQSYKQLIANSLYNNHQLIRHGGGYAITTVHEVPHIKSKSLKTLYQLYDAYLAGMHHGIRLVKGQDTKDYLWKNPKPFRST